MAALFGYSELIPNSIYKWDNTTGPQLFMTHNAGKRDFVAMILRFYVSSDEVHEYIKESIERLHHVLMPDGARKPTQLEKMVGELPSRLIERLKASNETTYEMLQSILGENLPKHTGDFIEGVSPSERIKLPQYVQVRLGWMPSKEADFDGTEKSTSPKGSIRFYESLITNGMEEIADVVYCALADNVFDSSHKLIPVSGHIAKTKYYNRSEIQSGLIMFVTGYSLYNNGLNKAPDASKLVLPQFALKVLEGIKIRELYTESPQEPQRIIHPEQRILLPNQMPPKEANLDGANSSPFDFL